MTRRRERIGFELQILRSYLDPSWVFASDDERLFLFTGEHGLTVQIALEDFPYAPPQVVFDRMLYDPEGRPMDSPSHVNHTLPAVDGKTRICYYKPSRWRSDESLWMVYCLAILWLEGYRKWMTTGTNTIDFWIDRIRNENA